MSTFYRVDFRCDGSDPLQRQLDVLYGYERDLETRVLHRARLNLFFLLLGDLVERGVVTRRGSALDIGCNAGVYSKMLSDAGFARVEGIDIDAEQVRRAVAAFASDSPGRAIAFRIEDAEAIDRSSRFDFILCTEVIEHTARPEAVVENLAAALAPGGVAVVTLPNAFSAPYAVARTTRRIRGRAPDPVLEDHLRYPFWRSLRLFDGTGLRLVGTTGTNLVFDARVLRALHRAPFFPLLNRAQFALARRWPLKYAAQFFFMVLKRDAGTGVPA
jgi:SAM-dependent methyltransferase